MTTNTNKTALTLAMKSEIVEGVDFKGLNIPTMFKNGEPTKYLNGDRLLNRLADTATANLKEQAAEKKFLIDSGIDPSLGVASAVYAVIMAAYHGKTGSHEEKTRYAWRMRTTMRAELLARIKGPAAIRKDVKTEAAVMLFGGDPKDEAAPTQTAEVKKRMKDALNRFDVPCSQLFAILKRSDAALRGLVPPARLTDGSVAGDVPEFTDGGKKIRIATPSACAKVAKILKDQEAEMPIKKAVVPDATATPSGQAAKSAAEEIVADVDKASDNKGVVNWDIAKKTGDLMAIIAATAKAAGTKKGPQFNEPERADVMKLAKALDDAITVASALYQRVDARQGTNQAAARHASK